MGLLERLRGVGSVDDLAGIMREERPDEAEFRIVLYQSTRRIGDAFAQRLPNVVEKVTNGEFTAEISGGVASILSTKAGGTVGTSQKIEVTPMMQALLLEEVAAEDDWLVDLGERVGRQGDKLLRFVGNGHIFGPRERLRALPEFAVTPELAKHIESTREIQQASMIARDPSHPGAFVWVAGGAGPIASIASFRETDENYDSYASLPPYGVLGHFEGGAPPLTMLAPLMIWHSTSDAYAVAERRVPDTVPSIATIQERDRSAARDAAPPRSSAAAARPSLGDYEILETIHTGPYGRVLKCRRGKALCVVKVTRVPWSPEALDQLTQLACPNLASPNRVWDEGGVLYEELPYIDGIPLSRLVRRGGTPLRGALLMSLHGHLDAVLTVLHAAGLVHRDVHPDNVFLVLRPDADRVRNDYLTSWTAFSAAGARESRFGDAADSVRGSSWAYSEFGQGENSFLAAWVLGDCTCAIRGGAMPQVAFRHGNYTSPEQEAGSATSASDVFALGGTLYYAIAAAAPPGAARLEELELPSLDSASFFLGELVSQMLAIRPEERPRAGEELRSSSIMDYYCGTVDMGNDTYLVMNTFESETALVQGRSALTTFLDAHGEH